METTVFIISAAICLAGAVGVIFNKNPVHAALSLVATLFGIAVLFVAQEAHFLAAVQVIVYAGAIVVLFLFVIMLLGVDRAENISFEPIVGQRMAAAVVGLAVLALPVVAIDQAGGVASGARAQNGSISQADSADVSQIGEILFTRYLLAFEVTSVLLVIAIVGAVVMARRVRGDQIEVTGLGPRELPEPDEAEEAPAPEDPDDQGTGGVAAGGETVGA